MLGFFGKKAELAVVSTGDPGMPYEPLGLVVTSVSASKSRFGGTIDYSGALDHAIERLTGEVGKVGGNALLHVRLEFGARERGRYPMQVYGTAARIDEAEMARPNGAAMIGAPPGDDTPAADPAGEEDPTEPVSGIGDRAASPGWRREPQAAASDASGEDPGRVQPARRPGISRLVRRPSAAAAVTDEGGGNGDDFRGRDK